MLATVDYSPRCLEGGDATHAACGNGKDCVEKRGVFPGTFGDEKLEESLGVNQIEL